MIKEISIEEFRDSGALWWINQQLHLFGMAIVVEEDDNKKKKKMYPVKCGFRGFSEETNTKNYKKLTNYLNNNIEELKTANIITKLVVEDDKITDESVQIEISDAKARYAEIQNRHIGGTA